MPYGPRTDHTEEESLSPSRAEAAPASQVTRKKKGQQHSSSMATVQCASVANQHQRGSARLHPTAGLARPRASAGGSPATSRSNSSSSGGARLRVIVPPTTHTGTRHARPHQHSVRRQPRAAPRKISSGSRASCTVRQGRLRGHPQTSDACACVRPLTVLSQHQRTFATSGGEAGWTSIASRATTASKPLFLLAPGPQ